eukprot:3799502-Prymnesium_polylepis.1
MNIHQTADGLLSGHRRRSGMPHRRRVSHRSQCKPPMPLHRGASSDLKARALHGVSRLCRLYGLWGRALAVPFRLGRRGRRQGEEASMVEL